MDKKCSKYEGLFIFSDEKTLNKHINECEECAAEHKKMQMISNLISEVKFYYLKKKRRLSTLSAACAAVLVLFFSAFFCIISSDGEWADVLIYGDALSIEDLGFPVDSYGLLMVDE